MENINCHFILSSVFYIEYTYYSGCLITLENYLNGLFIYVKMRKKSIFGESVWKAIHVVDMNLLILSSFGETFLLQAPFNLPDLHLFLIYVDICVFWFRRWLIRNQRLRKLKFAGRMSRNDFYVLLEAQSLKGNELDLERFSCTLMLMHHICYLRWNDLDFD